MFERLSERCRGVMASANREARRFNQEYIGTEYLLMSLVKEGSGIGAHALKNLDIDLEEVAAKVEKLVVSGNPHNLEGLEAMATLPQTHGTKKVIEYSIGEARGLDHGYVGTEHLLLGLATPPEGDEKSIAYDVLTGMGVGLDELRDGVRELLGMGVGED